MRSRTKLFFLFALLVLFFKPENMRPVLSSSSSKTSLFELHTLPHGYLTFLGDSHLQDRDIALTNENVRSNKARSAGVVLYRHPILFRDPRSKMVPSFYTMFAFSIGYLDGNEKVDGDKETSGDGLAFLISPNDDLIGSPGYMGLVDSTELNKNKFIAIEFDTRCDSMFHDPNDNHVGLDINNLYSVATSSSLGVNLKSGDLINAWIEYNSNEKRLEVFLSYSYLKPKKPLLKVDIDLSDYLKENMFVGFSSATEGSMQVVLIEQWEFTIAEFRPPPPPSPPELGRTFSNPSQSEHRQTHSAISWFAIGLTIGACSVPLIVLFGWFCFKKLIGMIRISEATDNLELQTIRSPGGISEIQLFILVSEIARGFNIQKVLDNEAELNHDESVKSSIPLCNSLPAVKPSILPLCNRLPLRTNDIIESADV